MCPNWKPPRDISKEEWSVYIRTVRERGGGFGMDQGEGKKHLMLNRSNPMDKRGFLLLVFLLLAFFHLITSSNAFPASSISGVRKLLDGASGGGQFPAAEDSMKMATNDEATLELDFTSGRMDLESNDYPGSGANNRHTPRPPGKP